MKMIDNVLVKSRENYNYYIYTTQKNSHQSKAVRLLVGWL